jgi:hypothetical protein
MVTAANGLRANGVQKVRKKAPKGIGKALVLYPAHKNRGLGMGHSPPAL